MHNCYDTCTPLPGCIHACCLVIWSASTTASNVCCLLPKQVPGRWAQTRDAFAIPPRLQAQSQQLLAYPEQQKLTARLVCLRAASPRTCRRTLGCHIEAALDKLPLNPGHLSMQLLLIPWHDTQCYDIASACLFAKVKGRDNDGT